MLGAGILEHLVEMFIDKGIALIKDNHEFNRLKDAINARIARELRFNSELLETIIRYKKLKNEKLISTLTGSLQTTAFDSINDSSIPLTLFSGESEIKPKDWSSIREKFPYPSSNFVKWSVTINNPTDLIERIYHRIKIIKLFASIDISKNQQSIKYVLFLISAYRQGIGK